MSALGTTTSSSAEAGVRDDNGLNEVDPIRTTVVSADMNHTLLEDWSSSLWWSLKLDVSHSLCSKELKRALFAKDVTNSKITQDTNHAYTYSAAIRPLLNDCGERKYAPEQEHSDNDTEIIDQTWIVRGIPERPLYREVAKRLLEWNQRCFSQGSSQPFISALADTNRCRVTVPAEALGFEERAFSHGRIIFPDLPPFSRFDIPNWLLSSRESATNNADATIYKVLGIRNTIGSLLPSEKRLLLLPSKRALLAAAGFFHEPNAKSIESKQKQRQQWFQQRLTVAAKARSKHAHRAIKKASFYGVAKGPVDRQNQEAEELVRGLLANCVWINCHVFGGLTKTNEREKTTIKNDDGNDLSSSWVVEIRQEQGYGARWRVEECRDVGANHDNGNGNGNGNDCNILKGRSSHPSVVVTFRGFLEPMMEDGHERRWRH